MSATITRRPATACATSGTRMALECARNVHAAVDRRMPEAVALAGWLAESAAALGLSDAETSDDADGFALSRRRALTVADWGKVGMALDAATAAPSSTSEQPADRWIAAIGDALVLDPLTLRILALALHYALDQRVDRLFDAMSECRGGATRLHRNAGLFALLLQAPTADVAALLAADGKLLASGLLRIERYGEFRVLERLVSLIRRDVPPATDFYDQLLGATDTTPLPWEAFAHLGREAEVAAAVLRAALAGKAIGVNILLYGPPGTGKTSFAATLAAPLAAATACRALATSNLTNAPLPGGAATVASPATSRPPPPQPRPSSTPRPSCCSPEGFAVAHEFRDEP